MSKRLRCEVKYQTLYWWQSPWGCATAAKVDSTEFGLIGVNTDGEVDEDVVSPMPEYWDGWTPVSQSAVGGSGTRDDPFKLTTKVRAANTGVTFEQADRYVTGDLAYSTSVEVENGSSQVRQIRLYRSGKCFLGGSEYGYGRLSLEDAQVGCMADPATPTSTIDLVGLTPGGQMIEGDGYGWPMTLPTPIESRCSCTSYEKNGLLLSWEFSLQPGESRVFDSITALSQTGQDEIPLAIKASDDSPSAGDVVRYTVSAQDTTGRGGRLDELEVQIPPSAHLVSGSVSAASLSDPLVSGNRLTFSSPGKVEPLDAWKASFELEYSSAGDVTLAASAASPNAVFAAASYSASVSGMKRPETPALIAPADGARVSDQDVRFSWRDSRRADRYDLIVDGVLEKRTSAREAVVTLTDGPHNWQLIAVNNAGSSQSETRTVTVASARPADNGWVDYSELAERYKPIFEVARSDGFWPIDFETVFRLSDSSKRPSTAGPIKAFDPSATCVRTRSASRRPRSCQVARVQDLRGSSGEGQYLDFPANVGFDNQLKMFRRALGTTNPTPSTTALYPYIGGDKRRQDSSFSLQYWAFYGYNHFNGNKFGIRGGHHEGDWEHVSLMFAGRRDDFRRRAQNPVPKVVFFVSHGGLKHPVGWDSSEMRRVGPGGTCDTTRPSPMAGRRDAICVYVARASHASYPKPGSHHLRTTEDDSLTESFKDRWHLGAARLFGLVGKDWACWRGRAGQPTSGAQSKLGITPPEMPLRQQGGNENVTDDCYRAPEAGAASRTKVPARAAASTSGSGVGGIGDLDRCTDWMPPIYRYGETRVTVCDQSRLTRWLANGFADDEEVFRMTSSTDGDDSGRSAVVSRSVPTRSVSKLVTDATVASAGAVTVETLVGAGRVERATFADVQFRPGAPISAVAGPDGRVSILDGGSQVRSVYPTAFWLSARVKTRAAWAASSVTARRVSRLGVKIRWTISKPLRGVEYQVFARLPGRREVRIGRAKGGRRTAEMIRRVPAQASSVYVVATKATTSVRSPRVPIRGR